MAGKTTNKAVSTADQPEKKKTPAKTPAHPVSTHDIAQPVEPTTMSDAEIAEENAGEGIYRSDESDIPAPVVPAEGAAQAKADKKIAKAKADLRALKEDLNPDALTIDDVADTAETEAQQDFSFDIRPDFQTMDETGIKAYMTHLTRWLRDRDAVVRGPTVTEHEIPDTTVTAITREGSTTPGSAKPQATTTVYEGFYEWEYADAPPITIRRVHVTAIDALRDTAHEAVVRRYEV